MTPKIVYNLKDEIERFISRRHLMHFLANNQSQEERIRKRIMSSWKVQRLSRQGQSSLQRIHVIAGGPIAGGTTHLGRKMYAQTVHMVETAQIKSKCPNLVIFTDNDMKGVNFLHSDAITVIVNVGSVEIRRLFINNGSSCEILFLEAYLKMKIKPSNMKPCSWGLVGFTGQEVPITRRISLLLTLDEWPKATTEILDFVVMDLPSSYNCVIRRPSQTLLSMVSSIENQITKFPTENGVRHVCGDQPTSINCYYSLMKNNGKTRSSLTNILEVNKESTSKEEESKQRRNEFPLERVGV